MMKRPLALLIVATVFCGCRAMNEPSLDPLFGPTRIPPPGTSAPDGARAAEPYYGGASGGVSQAPAGQGRIGTQIGSAQEFQTAGGRGATSDLQFPSGERQQGLANTADFVDANPNGASGRVTQADYEAPLDGRTAAAGQPSIGGIQQMSHEVPRSGSSGTTWRSITSPLPQAERAGAPRRLPGDNAIDSGVTPLPQPVTSTTSSGPSADDQASHSVRRVASSARYDYDPEYTWLRGKLEYSDASRRWRLRYITIDGDTDRFGGSVVLPDSPLLAGYKSGEFVRVEGALREGSSRGLSYAPRFDVARIARQ